MQTGLIVCAWHSEFHKPHQSALHGWVYVFRRRSYRQKCRLIYLKLDVMRERIVSHGVCRLCSHALLAKENLRGCSVKYTIYN